MANAILMMGAPGSGKGTQARLLAERFGHYHFDTGKVIERMLYNSRAKGDAVVQERRKEFEEGLLLDPQWVLQCLTQFLEHYGRAGIDLVFSGSPRTLFEAKGDYGVSGFIDILERYYSRDQIFIFQLQVPHEESIRRNTSRLVCSICGLQYLSIPKCVLETECPFCDGPLRKRTLDTHEAMQVRLKEYVERTGPIFDEFIRRGYTVRPISGEGSPYTIHETITHQITG